jgi:hypothetical protein
MIVPVTASLKSKRRNVPTFMGDGEQVHKLEISLDFVVGVV